MAIKDWPSSERPREKLLLQDASVLSDAELLAIFFRTGTSGRTAVDLGRDALSRFGGLRGLLNASSDDFSMLPGLGPAKYANLQAALEIGRRYLGEQLKKEGALTSSKQVRRFLVHKLRDQQREVFSVLFLDNRNRLIYYEEMFKGTINCASIHPREVVRASLKHNAAAVIVAHNHPSGIAEPSSADIHITDQLKRALSLVDVRLLDHIVVGEGESISLSDRGLLESSSPD